MKWRNNNNMNKQKTDKHKKTRIHIHLRLHAMLFDPLNNINDAETDLFFITYGCHFDFFGNYDMEFLLLLCC